MRYSPKGADDMHHASRGDDMPSLREPPKLGKLASGNPYCGLDKKIRQVETCRIFCTKAAKKIFFEVCIKDSNSNEFYVVTDLDDIYINVYLQILLTLDIMCLFYKQ